MSTYQVLFVGRRAGPMGGVHAQLQEAAGRQLHVLAQLLLEQLDLLRKELKRIFGFKVP